MQKTYTEGERIAAGHKGIVICGDEPSTHNMGSILTQLGTESEYHLMYRVSLKMQRSEGKFALLGYSSYKNASVGTLQSTIVLITPIFRPVNNLHSFSTYADNRQPPGHIRRLFLSKTFKFHLPIEYDISEDPPRALISRSKCTLAVSLSYPLFLMTIFTRFS